MSKVYSLSVVIPTFNRGSVLLATIDLLMAQLDQVDEILIIDQTVYKDGDPVSIKLKQLSNTNHIIWIQLTKPSIPVAMNKGLITAKSDHVLFLDDDVDFDTRFVGAHKHAIQQSHASAHVGQILQPGESSQPRTSSYQAGLGLSRDLAFPFRSDRPALIHNCMAGNLLVNRQAAINCGGFDEQFSGSAYRFETEFCRRMIKSTGLPFYFVPSASLKHLKIPSGGTRHQVSNFLTSSLPIHSQGDYYFCLKCGKTKFETWQYISLRFFSSLRARLYLTKPWWVPVRIIAEVRGLIAALIKHKQGEKLIN